MKGDSVVRKGMLIDVTMCVGCCSCEEACSEVNDLPETDDQDLSSRKFTKVMERGEYYVRRMCMHCLDPACASVCPVGALEKLPVGPVVYHEDRCIGCRYCMQACPYQVPTYEWDKALPRVRKCWFCAERVVAGKQPACAEWCPTGATKFGDRDALLKEARDRIRTNPEQYVDHIYGEREVGGTSMLYLAPVPFRALGFKWTVGEESLPMLTWRVLSRIPDFVLVGGVLLLGIGWVVNRRIELEQEKLMEPQSLPDTDGSWLSRFLHRFKKQ